MKITMLLDDKDNVIATVRSPQRKSEDTIFGILPKPGQRIQEIDLPSHLENAEAEVLHKELKQHIKK